MCKYPLFRSEFWIMNLREVWASVSEPQDSCSKIVKVEIADDYVSPNSETNQRRALLSRLISRSVWESLSFVC